MGNRMTGCKPGTLSFCSAAENSVLGCPFVLEGLQRMHEAGSEPCHDMGWWASKKMLSLTVEEQH